MPTDPFLSLAGRAGAFKSWGNTADRTARTQAAREKFEQRFLDAADGDPVRAEALRRAYFADLALKSAQARRRRSRSAIARGDLELAAELRAAADELRGGDAA